MGGDGGMVVTPMQTLGVIGPSGGEKKTKATEYENKIKIHSNSPRVARINKMHKIW